MISISGFCLRRVLASLLLATVSLAARGQSQQVDYTVQIDAPSPLRALLESNLSLIRWHGNERIDVDQLRRLFEQGKDETARLLSTEGYYTPDISATLDDSGGRWIARYHVVPNQQVSVEKVDIQFTGAIAQVKGPLAAQDGPDPVSLRSAWTLPPGQVFRHADWELAKRRLLQRLLILRYPLASVTASRAEVDVRTSRVVLSVTVDSGPAVRFGPLHVEGLKRYPATVVSNLNPVRVGAPYDQQLLFDLQRRLADTGYFSRIDVGAVPEAPDAGGVSAPAIAPVVVNVDENKSKQLSFGAGYSTNTGYRGSVGFNQLDAFGGLAQLRSTLALETLKQSIGTDMVFPVTAEGYHYTLSALAQQQDVQGEKTRGLNLSAKRSWGPDATQRVTSLDYILERKSVADVQTELTQTLSASYGVTFRRTDSLLLPTSGYILATQAAAGARLTNGLPFARAYARYVGYFPLAARNTVILRAEGGVLAGKDRESFPSELLFRAGGDQSVRGYGYQSLGVTQAGAIVGGRYLAVGSGEVVHWFGARLPNWGVATFVDAGNAADHVNDLKPQVGYGVGTRWRSPVGVLNLDVARGVQNNTTRLHFSLGISF